MVNMDLVDELGISEETLLELKKCHCYRDKLESFMETLDPDVQYERKMLKDFYQLWTGNEFLLQELWGFEKDMNRHMNYRIPHCCCPELDNDELLGFDGQLITEGCPYHHG